MKHIVLFFIVIISTASYGKAQGSSASNSQDSVTYGYYYCFVLAQSDSVVFSPIFKEPQDTTALKPLIEQSWQNYVNNILNLSGYVTLVAGPFKSSDFAWQDRHAWLSTISDPVVKTEVPYTYSSNR
jgi:hypothetical protein